MNELYSCFKCDTIITSDEAFKVTKDDTEFGHRFFCRDCLSKSTNISSGVFSMLVDTRNGHRNQ